MTGMPTIAFWYDFASTYAYLSAMRIETAARAAGVEVAWKAFLLGPIFKAQGWDTSPFNIYPAKGRYMIRDIERISAARGIKFHMPQQFPAKSLMAARLSLQLENEGLAAAFGRAVFEAQFRDGKDIGEGPVLRALLDRLGLNSARLVSLIGSDASKQALRARTARAQALGVFGAPTFVTADGELFWGDDRLEIRARMGRKVVNNYSCQRRVFARPFSVIVEIGINYREMKP